MQQIYYLLGGLTIVAVLCFLPVSCDKKEDIRDDNISADKTELIFSETDNENKEFNISCDGEWHLEADELSLYYGVNMASIRDFTIEPVFGKGNTKMTVALKDERPEITENYEVDLKVVGGSNQVVVKLKAVAAESNPDE
ncbi:MAG: hypothetical protein LBF08_08115 [Dysgonamonadaceae bacterium]|jgi:hypothetical protein|nr:hypothetical protein [Dysgonamonadaceae bacterium]